MDISHFFIRIILLIAMIGAVHNVNAGVLDSVGSLVTGSVETAAYGLLKVWIIANGKSETHADCVVEYMKEMGATEDMKHALLNPQVLFEALKTKSSFADFICNFGGLTGAILCALFPVILIVALVTAAIRKGVIVYNH